MTLAFSQLNEWLTWLETLHPTWMDLGLERVGQVATRLEVTHFSCPVITVTGTNGKGSTVALLEAIYRAAGYRVGAYTSPHLLRFNERIRVDGLEIDDATLCQSFVRIEASRHDTSLTYFEFTTLAALDIFQRAHLDIIILEVGLGGRLDATNLVDADVAVLTTIALDHQAWLGNTREAIGYEKSGIMRKGHPVVCGDPDPPQSVRTAAAQLQAPLYVLDSDFDFNHDPVQSLWSFQSSFSNYETLPIPRIELQNAATALMTIEILQQRLPVSLVAVHNGLQQVFIAGRFQCIPGDVLTILDVAHNPAGGAWLAQRLRQEQPTAGRVIAVWAMLADKEMADTVRPLVPVVTEWFIGALGVARAADGQALEAALLAAQVQHYQIFSNFAGAYQAALSYAKRSDTLLVFGSFHTVAHVLRQHHFGGE